MDARSKYPSNLDELLKGAELMEEVFKFISNSNPENSELLTEMANDPYYWHNQAGQFAYDAEGFAGANGEGLMEELPHRQAAHLRQAAIVSELRGIFLMLGKLEHYIGHAVVKHMCDTEETVK